MEWNILFYPISIFLICNTENNHWHQPNSNLWIDIQQINSSHTYIYLSPTSFVPNEQERVFYGEATRNYFDWVRQQRFIPTQFLTSVNTLLNRLTVLDKKPLVKDIPEPTGKEEESQKPEHMIELSESGWLDQWRIGSVFIQSWNSILDFLLRSPHGM